MLTFTSEFYTEEKHCQNGVRFNLAKNVKSSNYLVMLFIRKKHMVVVVASQY